MELSSIENMHRHFNPSPVQGPEPVLNGADIRDSFFFPRCLRCLATVCKAVLQPVARGGGGGYNFFKKFYMLFCGSGKVHCQKITFWGHTRCPCLCALMPRQFSSRD